jgi:putative hydrolase of the HAD superfamily
MSFQELIRQNTESISIIPTDAISEGVLQHGIEVVLFDIYGTLFISGAGDISIAKRESEQHISKLEDLLRKYNLEKTSAELLDEFFYAIDQSKESLAKKGIDYPEVDIEKVWETVTGFKDRLMIQRFAVEYELIINPVWPMPHAKELLCRCKKQAIPMGIISNAQFYTPCLFPSLLGKDLEDLGFAKELMFFSYVYGYCKPSLVLFEMAAHNIEKVDIPREKVLYVGNDMLKDIYPAKKTGFQAALFAGDARSLNMREDDEKVKGVTPDLIITDLSQLLKILD